MKYLATLITVGALTLALASPLPVLAAGKGKAVGHFKGEEKADTRGAGKDLGKGRDKSAFGGEEKDKGEEKADTRGAGKDLGKGRDKSAFGGGKKGLGRGFQDLSGGHRLPPGLAKRSTLPPGLAKRWGALPPGLAKDHPVPPGLSRRPLPPGLSN